MTGYCTTEDVRRVFQDASLSGALADNNRRAVVDAVEGLTEWIDQATLKHWYVPGGISEDNENIVDASAKNRNDEHSLPSHSAYVVGAYDDNPRQITTTTGTVFSSRTGEPEPKEQIRLAFGDLEDDTIPAYTRITLERKNVVAVNILNVVNKDGGFDDWVASNDYSGGVGNSNRGDDWWVRVNNHGVSELYLDVHAMDDDLASLSNAVYVDIDYGQDSLPKTVRRGVAQLAASELVQHDEFRTAIPNDGQLMNLETKAETWERRGLEKLKHHFIDSRPSFPSK